MEGEKKSGSSFTSELFGSKDSDVAASSSGIFGSIFAPAAKWPQAVGNDSLHMPEKEKKHDSGSQSWNSKTAVSVTVVSVYPNVYYARPSASFAESSVVKGEANFQKSEGKDMGPFYPGENVHPCHYSSSIYYGGQDIYSQPQTAQSTVFTTFNKDGAEDDTDGASRGNWWQGSLYY